MGNAESDDFTLGRIDDNQCARVRIRGMCNCESGAAQTDRPRASCATNISSSAQKQS